MLLSCQPVPLPFSPHPPAPPTASHASSSKTILQNGALVLVASLEKSGGRPKTYLCTYEGCGKAYTRPTRLEEHVRSHTGERPFKCPECPSTFLRDSHLKAHLRTHSKGDEGKRYDCDECEKKFWTNQHLKKHKEVAHDTFQAGTEGEETEMRTVKIYTCPHCPTTTNFKKHKLLRNHVAFYHPSTPTLEAPPPLPFVCPEPHCPKSFTQSAHLKSHLKTHDPSRYLCSHPSCLLLPLSERQFGMWSLLQEHSKEAHPPTCPHVECKGRKFTTNRGLKGHLEVHRLKEEGIKGGRRRKRRRQKDSEEEEGEEGTGTEEEEEGYEEDEEVLQNQREERLVNYEATAGSRKGKKRKVVVDVASPWKCEVVGCRNHYKSAGALENHVALKHSALPPPPPSSIPSTAQPKTTSTPPATATATATAIPNPQVSLIDLLTGHGYAPLSPDSSQSKGIRDRKYRCPYPQVGGLPVDGPFEVGGDAEGEDGSVGEEGEQEGDAVCAYRFSRVYDVERHLRSSHGIRVERENLEDWFEKEGEEA